MGVSGLETSELKQSVMQKSDTSWSPVCKWRMTNFGSMEIQFVMLFEQTGLLLSCYLSSPIAHPKQAYNRPQLPALQDRHFASSILCITNYFNFDDFNPDSSILHFSCT